jgi:hypothetical protein
MKIDDITQAYRSEYHKTCECCGLDQLILTQKDNFPEYETEIYLQCQCGEFIEFTLPVN